MCVYTKCVDITNILKYRFYLGAKLERALRTIPTGQSGQPATANLPAGDSSPRSTFLRALETGTLRDSPDDPIVPERSESIGKRGEVPAWLCQGISASAGTHAAGCVGIAQPATEGRGPGQRRAAGRPGGPGLDWETRVGGRVSGGATPDCRGQGRRGWNRRA